MFVLAIALQQGLRMTAIVAGLALVPFVLSLFLASLAGPRMVSCFGAGRVVTFGVATVGSLFLALIGPWNMRDALLVTLLVLLGLIVLTTALSLRLPRSIS
jgi:hypothetical protein